MWKTRRRTEAVSPVIATILMVAITVVLAAVLYVMVMGFGGPSTQTPTGSFVGTPQQVSVGTVTGYQLTWGVISPSTQWTQCKMVVTVGGVASAATAITVTPGSNPNQIALLAPNLVLSFTDLAKDGVISTGDYMTINSGTVAIPANLVAGSYTVTLLFTTTGGSICAQSWTF